ncbi:unnamed protein product [Gadus morhua 'NCC']
MEPHVDSRGQQSSGWERRRASRRALRLHSEDRRVRRVTGCSSTGLRHRRERSRVERRLQRETVTTGQSGGSERTT